VGFVAVDLDGNMVVGVGEVNPADEPGAVADLMLTDGSGKTVVPAEAQHAGFENRLRQLVALGALVEQHTEHADALAPSPGARIENRSETAQSHQLSAEGDVEGAFNGPQPLNGTEVENGAKGRRDRDPVPDGARDRSEIPRAVHDDSVEARVPTWRHRELDQGATRRV